MTTPSGNPLPLKDIHNTPEKASRSEQINHRGETGRNPLLASTLTRNIKYIKYLNNKCNSTLVKQALDYETSKKDNRQTILSLVQKHENTLTLQIANNEDIWTISNINLVKLCTKSLTVYGRDKYPFTQRLQHISYLKIE